MDVAQSLGEKEERGRAQMMIPGWHFQEIIDGVK